MTIAGMRGAEGGRQPAAAKPPLYWQSIYTQRMLQYFRFNNLNTSYSEYCKFFGCLSSGSVLLILLILAVQYLGLYY